MPNRILKDSICTSPNIDALSREAEAFFYRLLVQCDDFGPMDARPAILRARCYPLRLDAITDKHVSAWLAELVRADLVMLYTVDGRQYLQMRTWERHQQVRAKRSKYPDMIASDGNCDQMITYVPVIQSNPIQYESESESSIAPDGADSPAPKIPNSLQQDMYGAVCETCELNPKLNPGKIAKIAKNLLSAGYTPEQVRAFKIWWINDAWRAEHTPVPTLAKLLELIEQSKNGNGRPRAAPVSTNGRGQSKVDRSLAAVEEVRQMLKHQGVQ